MAFFNQKGPQGKLFLLVLFVSLSFATRESVFNESNSVKYIGSYGFKAFYAGLGIQLPWGKAWEFCRAHQMHLASIESSTENHFVMKFLDDFAPEGVNDRDWWLSGTDLVNEGKFVWMSSGREFSFQNWSPGNPNNANEGEHCVQLGINVEPRWRNWNDNNCNSSFHALCEEDTGKRALDIHLLKI